MGDRRGLDQRQQLRVHQQHFGAAVIENPAKLARLQPRIQHHQNGPDQHGAEVRFQSHRAVGRQHRDAVARADSELMQSAGQAMHASLEFAIGEAPVAIHYGGGVAVDHRAAGQKIDWGERGNHIQGTIVPPLRRYQYRLGCSAGFFRLTITAE